MLLSSRRYLSSNECGEMRYLQTFLEDELHHLSMAAQQCDPPLWPFPPTSTLSISMVWELARIPAANSLLTGCQRNYAIELIYDCASWTSAALTEIAERSATALHEKFSAAEIICGNSPERRHRMDLQMHTD